MENYVKKMVIDYIKKNIGNYTDIKISNYSGRVTGVLNYPHSKQPRQRVFIGWDNEFLAYIKEENNAA